MVRLFCHSGYIVLCLLEAEFSLLSQQYRQDFSLFMGKKVPILFPFAGRLHLLSIHLKDFFSLTSKVHKKNKMMVTLP